MLEPYRIAGGAWVAMGVSFVGLGVWRAVRYVRNDFAAIFEGAQAVFRGGDPYETSAGGYIYPPLLAVLQSALVPLGLGGASLAWGLVNLGALYLACRLSYAILADRLRLSPNPNVRWAMYLVPVLTLISPVQQLLVNGQTDAILLLGFVLALRWIEDEPTAAGLALGFVANIKYTALALVPYLLLRGRVRSATATVGGTVLFALAPAAVLGWSRNLAYLRRAVGGMLTLFGMEPESLGTGPLRGLHPITFNQSVSLTSTAARLSDALGGGWPLVLAVVGLLGLIVLACVGLSYRAARVALWAGRGGRAEREPMARAMVPLEWMTVLLLVALFSPQYLVRHMVVLIPLLMILCAMVFVPRVEVPRWPLAACVVLLMLATSQPSWGGSGPGSLRRAWRAGGGPSWCLLALYLTVLWYGLRYAGAVVRDGLAGRPAGPAGGDGLGDADGLTGRAESAIA